MTLLIVDDEYYSILGIREGIAWNELEFDHILDADSFESAKKVFTEEKVDVMLCDIEMPNGNGMALVEWVKSNAYETVCIFLTCHSEFSFAQRAIQLGCMDYVLKPPIPDVVVPVLKKAAALVKENTEKKNYEKYGKNYLEVENLKLEGRMDPVTEIEIFLRENIRDQFSVTELAQKVAISPDYLARLFKKKHNKTISEYATDLRLDMAAEMLKQDIPLSSVAEEVGYLDYAYFNRLFRKKYGVSPKEYRSRIINTK